MKKILVIEDDKNIALALVIRLRSQGYEVGIAYDAVTGLSQTARFKPDLILLDISMPGGNGLLVAERVRALAPVAATPIIFITASKNPAFRTKALELAAADFFEKPYEAEELLASIRRILGGEEDVARPHIQPG
ncbi:MAG: response regulator [Deltaproteobacteria bacterium]|nr:response regulator [Deltaproteobacteria bacterium]